MTAKGILCFQTSHIQNLGITYVDTSNCLYNVTQLNPAGSFFTTCGYTPLQHAIKGSQYTKFPTEPCSGAMQIYGQTDLTDPCSNTTRWPSFLIPKGLYWACGELLVPFCFLVGLDLAIWPSSLLPSNSFP